MILLLPAFIYWLFIHYYGDLVRMIMFLFCLETLACADIGGLTSHYTCICVNVEELYFRHVCSMYHNIIVA